MNSISILLERLSRVLQNGAHIEGLKPTQWEALRYLARANRFSRSPGAVTAYLGVTKGTVSQTLSALERKELISKQAAASDKRNVDISVTALGTKYLAKDPAHSLDMATGNLTTEESSRLAEALEAILVTALRQRGGKAFGACKTCRYFKVDDVGEAPYRCTLLNEALSETDSEQICFEQLSA